MDNLVHVIYNETVGSNLGDFVEITLARVFFNRKKVYILNSVVSINGRITADVFDTFKFSSDSLAIREAIKVADELFNSHPTLSKEDNDETPK